MSRNTATRLGALVALSVVFALALGLYITGCTTGDIGNDLGLVNPGCREPSECFVTGVDCPCRYNTVFQINASGGALPQCRRSPDVNSECNAVDGQAVEQCMEPQEVCVGRAATTCNGVGARCIHAGLGQTCDTSGAGDPPDSVATGPGGSLELRCPYVDDTCCPGTIAADGGSSTIDGSTVDGG